MRHHHVGDLVTGAPATSIHCGTNVFNRCMRSTDRGLWLPTPVSMRMSWDPACTIQIWIAMNTRLMAGNQ